MAKTMLFGRFGEAISQIQDGDTITAGGHIGAGRIFPLLVDTGSFEGFFKKLESQLEKNKPNMGALESNLKAAKHPSSLGVQTFAKLMAFTKGLEKVYPFSEKSKQGREKMYRQEKPPFLSEIIFSGFHMCVECAALAQLWLQRQDVDSWLMAGGYLKDDDSEEYAHPHQFIVLPGIKDVLLYDPSRPIGIKGFGDFPKIYKINMCWDLFVECMQTGRAFVECHPLFSDTVYFYGSSPVGSVYEKQKIRG